MAETGALSQRGEVTLKKMSFEFWLALVATGIQVREILRFSDNVAMTIANLLLFSVLLFATVGAYEKQSQKSQQK